MLKDIFNKYNIILGSSSKRRKELLHQIGFNFKIIRTNKKEIYPYNLKSENIAIFLAKQKSSFLLDKLEKNNLLITADTTVILNDEILHKPTSNYEALNMLLKLSNKKHKVITGVCISTIKKVISFSTMTEVKFKKLKKKELEDYILEYKPLDKSGGYGIQDPIGKNAEIKGSYSNVVGLPLSDLYDKLKQFK